MNRAVRPPGLPPPAARYELAMVSEGTRLLHTAGIVPVAPDGTVPEDVAAQADRVWATVGSLLDEAGFTIGDIVSYTTYVVAGHDLEAVMAARDRFFGGHAAASTLVTVPALARPEWKTETTVVAHRS